MKTEKKILDGAFLSTWIQKAYGMRIMEHDSFGSEGQKCNWQTKMNNLRFSRLKPSVQNGIACKGISRANLQICYSIYNIITRSRDLCYRTGRWPA